MVIVPATAINEESCDLSAVDLLCQCPVSLDAVKVGSTWGIVTPMQLLLLVKVLLHQKLICVVAFMERGIVEEEANLPIVNFDGSKKLLDELDEAVAIISTLLDLLHDQARVDANGADYCGMHSRLMSKWGVVDRVTHWSPSFFHVKVYLEDTFVHLKDLIALLHQMSNLLLSILDVPLLGHHILQLNLWVSYWLHDLLLGDMVLLVQLLELGLCKLNVEILFVVEDSGCHGHVGLLGESLMADHELDLLVGVLVLLLRRPTFLERISIIRVSLASLDLEVHRHELLELAVANAKDHSHLGVAILGPDNGEHILAAIV